MCQALCTQTGIPHSSTDSQNLAQLSNKYMLQEILIAVTVLVIILAIVILSISNTIQNG